MKKTILFLLAGALIAIGFLSFTSNVSKASGVEFMEVTTIESIIPMGLGRSRMFTTNSNNSQDEVNLENFYSGVGINLGNIKQNDAAILQKINTLSAEGWELMYVTAGVQSPTDAGKQGIYLTRYLFRKAN